MALAPRRIDISQDTLTQDFSVDPEKFKKCCRTFFPIHRIFVSYKQLYAAADLLFRQWKILMKTSKKVYNVIILIHLIKDVTRVLHLVL